jgi:hypothetical protein
MRSNIWTTEIPKITLKNPDEVIFALSVLGSVNGI